MIGEKLGKYLIREKLGTGSMGTVYKGEDSSNGRPVAVKLVKSHILYDAPKRERFLQRLLLASQIRHPGVCPILEIGDDEDDFFVIMPFLEGRRLQEKLFHGPLAWQEALDVALQVGEALSAGHKLGLIHRSLKPSNVWHLKDGTVQVTDFDLARFTEMEKGAKISPTGPRAEFADTIIPMGTLGYMSPEQVRGDPVDSRSDIFSLGVVLYEMLTGIHPFDSRNSLSRMHLILEGSPPPVGTRGTSLPGELNAILQKALAKSPGERYQEVDEFLACLRSVRADGAVPAPPGELVAKSGARPSVRSFILFSGLLLLLALLVYSFLVWTQSG